MQSAGWVNALVQSQKLHGRLMEKKAGQQIISLLTSSVSEVYLH